MACFFLTTAVGDMLAGVLYSSLQAVLTPMQIALLLAGLMAVAGAAFAGLAVLYKPRARDVAVPAASKV